MERGSRVGTSPQFYITHSLGSDLGGSDEPSSPSSQMSPLEIGGRKASFTFNSDLCVEMHCVEMHEPGRHQSESSIHNLSSLSSNESGTRANLPLSPSERSLSTKASIHNLSNCFHQYNVQQTELIEKAEKLRDKVGGAVDHNVAILNDIFRDVIMMRRQQMSSVGGTCLKTHETLVKIETDIREVIVGLKGIKIECDTGQPAQ